MKKLLVILLIALATCAAIEENFDDDVVLEKNFIKKGVDKVKKGVKNGVKGVKKEIKKGTDKVKDVVKHPGKIVKQTTKDILKNPIKGLNGLFKGKIGQAFRKLKEVVKKGIAFLKQNNLWEPLVQKARELGAKYGNQYCEKVLPPEICGPAVDFVLNHVIKN